MPHSFQPAPHIMVCPEQRSEVVIVSALLPHLPSLRSVTAFHLPVYGCAPAPHALRGYLSCSGGALHKMGILVLACQSNVAYGLFFFKLTVLPAISKKLAFFPKLLCVSQRLYPELTEVGTVL